MGGMLRPPLPDSICRIEGKAQGKNSCPEATKIYWSPCGPGARTGQKDQYRCGYENYASGEEVWRKRSNLTPESVP